jgi:predicted nucleotidyltransferase component of viral defense system
MCVEVEKFDCLLIQHEYIFIKKSMTWLAVPALAHNLFHKICAEDQRVSGRDYNPFAARPDAARRRRFAVHKSRVPKNWARR